MQAIWDVLAEVPDQEIPVVSVVDLGIVRSVEDGRVVITPTYSGCPATLAIEQSIREALDSAGYRRIRIDAGDRAMLAPARHHPGLAPGAALLPAQAGLMQGAPDRECADLGQPIWSSTQGSLQQA